MNYNGKNKALKWIILGGSIFLFAVSLTQFAYCTTLDLDGDCTQGISALLVGWMGIVGLGAAVTWFANPFLFLAWGLAMNSPKYAVLTSGFSLMLMLLFLMFDEVMINEAGDYSKIVAIGSGYWLLVSSSFVMLAGNILAMRNERNAQFSEVIFLNA